MLKPSRLSGGCAGLDLLLSRDAVVLQFVSEGEVHREQLRGLTETIIKGAPNALGSWMIRK